MTIFENHPTSNWPNFADTLIGEKLDLNVCDVFPLLPEDQSFCWLHSGSGEQHIALIGIRWSIEGHQHVWKWTDQQGEVQTFERRKGDFASTLDHIHQTWLVRQDPQVRLGLFMAYEAGWDNEVRRVTPRDLTIPEVLLFCPLEILIFNANGATRYRDRHQASLLRNSPRPYNENFAREVYIKAQQSKEDYLQNAHAVIEHIRAGNSFQVNLSQKIHSDQKPDVLSWAEHAIKTQAASFSAFLNWPSVQILSLSPERLLHQTPQRHLITRPIAGTLPRQENTTLEELENFRNNPKECAEHNMLIDLERNDLGKVCQAGSVQVEEYLTIETLPHVYHLVSQVGGDLNPDVGPGTAIFSTFPGGTITGCPKLETMHILDELETEERGAYTGALGYLSPKHFDTNILIRSAQIDEFGLHMRFGGGIVWDSNPEKEYQETLAKARGLIRSLLEGGAQIDSHHRPFRQFFS